MTHDLAPQFPHDAVAELAARHRRAQGGVMSVLNRLGTAAEGPMKALPKALEGRLLQATDLALRQAYGLAEKGGRFGRLGARAQMALGAVTGAAGGLGGVASAMVELPVSITLILRAIQEVAIAHGYDPRQEDVARECLRVFASGGPFDEDDGVNTAFIGARLSFTGPAIHGMIAKVAPKVAAAMGQKLAAQAVPILGAVTGAGMNLAYVRYYREMAEVRFGLLRLAEQHGPEAVTAAFLAAVSPKGRVTKNRA